MLCIIIPFFALLLAIAIVRSIFKGETSIGAFLTVRRDEDPITFWLRIVFLILIEALLAVFLIYKEFSSVEQIVLYFKSVKIGFGLWFMGVLLNTIINGKKHTIRDIIIGVVLNLVAAVWIAAYVYSKNSDILPQAIITSLLGIIFFLRAYHQHNLSRQDS